MSQLAVMALLALAGTTWALEPMVLADCKNPNGTDTKEHWWQCAAGAITTHSATPTTAANVYEYPIHINKKLIVHNKITSTKQFASLRADIAIWQWGGWLGCSWHSVPTLGLLSNIDPCTQGTKCPVPSGDSEMLTVVDFSKYSAITGVLPDNVPYQLQMILKDHANGDAHISCVTFQAIALKK